MTNFKEITGDLLAQRGGVIAHQANCTSDSWSGLAAAIFEKWPRTNTYRTDSNLSSKRFVGEIHWFYQVEKDTHVANIYSQYNRGKCYTNNEYDTIESRLMWFEIALARLKYSGFTNFFFPKYYGCGLAGGDWNVYRKILLDFATNNQHLTVTIVELQK